MPPHLNTCPHGTELPDLIRLIAAASMRTRNTRSRNATPLEREEMLDLNLDLIAASIVLFVAARRC